MTGLQFSSISVTSADVTGLKLLELLRSTKFVGHGWVWELNSRIEDLR